MPVLLEIEADDREKAAEEAELLVLAFRLQPADIDPSGIREVGGTAETDCDLHRP